MGWRRYFRRAWWADERSRELESYLELETEDNLARGMSPDEAVSAARRKLGNTARIREEIYAMNTVTLVDWLRQDIRYGARVLRRNPGFTIAAVLTLALGIGGVTVIYSALRNILLDPFPYANPDRMVNVYVTNAETGERLHNGAMGQDEVIDFVEPQTAFETVVVSTTDAGVMRTATGSGMITVTEMTANSFPYLAVQPLKGRVFTDADTLPGAAPVAVLAHATWIEEFGGRDDVLGQVITVNDTPRTVIGVMPERFGWQATSMWVPLALRRGVTPPDERRFWYQASVKPGVTLAEASERMTTIVKRRALAHPDEYPPQVRIDVLDLRYRVVGRFSTVLFTLLGAVVLLLLIACCNVANMLLARATTREREMTLRAALGGGRLRIMAHLLTESGLLALGGAVGGCLLAWWGMRAIAAILPPQGIAAEVQLRLVPEALLASLALAVLTTMIVGIVPAWNASRQDLANGMRESGKGAGASNRHGWLRQGLVVAEVALSLVLLLGSGLLIRNFVALLGTDLGVDPTGLASVVPAFDPHDQRNTAQRHSYYTEALARARAIPGVQGVALASSGGPLSGPRLIANRPGRPVPPDVRGAVMIACDEHYLGLMELPPLRGRTFTSADMTSAAHVVVITRTFADRYFGNEDPVGQYIELPELAKAPARLDNTTFSVIGVVADVRNAGWRERPAPGVYLPTTLSAAGRNPRQIIARTSGNAEALAPALEQAVRAVDLAIPVLGAGTFEASLQQNFHAQPRFSLIILSTFAVVGLLLVAIGVYGVMAYAVARRSQEFAIRMAIGATQRDVLGTVLKSGAWLLGIGVISGLLLSRFTNRWVLAALLETDAGDAASGLVGVAVIVTVGAAACLIPGWRAARTSPMTALRQD